MTCPNCGAQTGSAFCPHCGAQQLSAAAPVITLPAPGKYLGNSDYLVVNKTCVTVYKAGLFGYKSHQLSFREITSLTYQAAGGKEGFLCFRGREDLSEAPATEDTYRKDPLTVRFGTQMSPKFHEIYTALLPLAQWNRNPVGPEPVLAEPPAQAVQSTTISFAKNSDSTPLARCPKCRSTSIRAAKRGYSFGWGLLGFFLIPVVGLLLGCIGAKSIRCHCLNCGRRWKP